jgi:peptidoglycan/xylan/chitin deacetylase (PgdA/CDA1 family)
MWIDVLFAAFKGRTRQRLQLDDRSFALDDPREADRAYRAATYALVRAARGERTPLLEAIRDQLRPESANLRLMMTWSEVRALKSAHPQIAIGSHSREHFSFSRMSQEEVCAELAGAHADIRRQLGIDAAHFAFPYGHDSPHAHSWLRDHGYRTACLTEPVILARPGSDALALRRLEACQDRSRGRFAYHTSGAHPSMSQALLLGRS